MSHDITIASELRQLAFHVEQLARQSNVASIANDQVRALADYLTLRAHVIELETELDRLRGPIGWQTSEQVAAAWLRGLGYIVEPPGGP